MRYLALVCTVLSLVLFTACGDTTTAEETMEEEPMEETMEPVAEEVEETPTIVGIAADDARFSTLVAAVKAAGLVETLNGEGPFTVFAPTNAAFEKLPEGTVASLLEPANKGKLTTILTYHVVAGAYTAADVVAAIQDNNGKFTIETVQGGQLTATLNGDKVVLTDAKGNKSTVVVTDVDAANGVIHAIDTVVMPS
jgi:uncharacterized surface protein with fasciclin (FAS1) repeats